MLNLRRFTHRAKAKPNGGSKVKKGRMISAALIIMLSTVIFGMSGDGGNVPVEPKKEAVNVIAKDNAPVTLSENTSQTSMSNTNETVKDRLGVDTSMPLKALEYFKEEYLKKEKQMFPMNRTTMLYNFKIDLNRYDDFLKIGIDLKNSGNPVESASYKDNTLYSDIIVIGRTLAREKINGAETFKIEILEVLKGHDILSLKLGSVPKFFNYFDPLNQEPVLEKKGLYFFDFAENINKDTHCWVQQIPGSTLLCIDDNSVVYEKNFKTLNYALYYKNNEKSNEKMLKSEKWRKKIDDLYISVKMNESWDVAVANVKKIIEINDDKNFYKKTFKAEATK